MSALALLHAVAAGSARGPSGAVPNGPVDITEIKVVAIVRVSPTVSSARGLTTATFLRADPDAGLTTKINVNTFLRADPDAGLTTKINVNTFMREQ